MTLDIRLPMGLLFSLTGALLVVYGITHRTASTAAGLNVNADWGTVLIVFGVSMLLLARRRAARALRGPA
jgi:hypothetical protein